MTRPAATPAFLVMYKNRVVRGQDGAAAVAENRVDAFVGEDLDDDLGASHRAAGESMSLRRCVAFFHGTRQAEEDRTWI